MIMNSFIYDTPIGKILIEDDGFSITRLTLAEENEKSSDNESELARKAYVQLCEYFDKQRKAFDLPLNPKGTAFQKSVWSALCQIPYGQTCSYEHIAKQIGSPKACRAVGSANNKNPILIVIPCHRVIGKNGSLTGYGAGLPVKQFLLELEKN